MRCGARPDGCRSAVQVVAGKPVGAVIAKVVEHVRFPLLPAEVLSKLEADNDKAPLVPVALISRAWKFLATKTPEPGSAQFRPRAGTKA